MAKRKNYGSEVKWIAISTNIFDDEKIKFIEKMPEGDAIIVIWFKLLIKAGRINDGGYVYISENVPYTEETMSYIFDRPINTIRLALQTFQKLGMVTISDTNSIFINNWYKYQKEDTLGKIREQGRLRQQRFRDNHQKNLLENKSNVTCNVTVTQSNALHDMTIHDNTIHEDNNSSNNSCSSCSSNENLTTTTATNELNSDQKLYGEFGNVCLTSSEYSKMLGICCSQKLLDELIEELSCAIGVGKYPPYKADAPNAHFILLRNFYDYRKTHPKANTPANDNKPVDEQVKYNEIVDSW